MSEDNVQSIYDCFPVKIKPPERLIQFIEWTLETFEVKAIPGFQGAWLNDFWIENGSYLADHFGLFLCQADGTRAGYWFYEGCSIEKAPIVILGSGSGQTDVRVIASSIEDFASRFVEGKTGIYDIDSLQGYDENGDETDDPNEFWDWDIKGWLNELGNWLETNWGITPEIRKQFIEKDPTQDHPDFEEYLDKWSEEQSKIKKQNPSIQELHKILSKYLPDPKEYAASIDKNLEEFGELLGMDSEDESAQPLELDFERDFSWLSAKFDVLIVGSKFEIWQCSYGQKPIEENDQVEPLFRLLRLDRGRQRPEEGLWFSAWVKVYSSGNVSICREDESDPPEFLGEKPTVSDYKADLLEFPRASRFIPAWLDGMMKNP
jgi:hypothetical protein